MADDKGFINLFNGKDFTVGQKGGAAKYTVEEGVIVGTAGPERPTPSCAPRNCMAISYSNTNTCATKLNSGVQIRSNMFTEDTTVDLADGKTRKIPKGRVHGYQVEIDPNKPDRMWSGSI